MSADINAKKSVVLSVICLVCDILMEFVEDILMHARAIIVISGLTDIDRQSRTSLHVFLFIPGG